MAFRSWLIYGSPNISRLLSLQITFAFLPSCFILVLPFIHTKHEIFSLWFPMILLSETCFVVFNASETSFLLMCPPPPSNASSCFIVVSALQTSSKLLTWCHYKIACLSRHFICEEKLWYLLSYMIWYITFSSNSVSFLLMTLVIKYFLWDFRLDYERQIYRLQNKCFAIDNAPIHAWE